MPKVLWILFCFLTFAWSEQPESSQLPIERDLYLSYESFPKELYKNQLFSVTAKIINTNETYHQLHRILASFDGIEILDENPSVAVKGYTTFETFYFKATKLLVKTPDLRYRLHRTHDEEVTHKQLDGAFINAIELHHDEKFCHIIANSFEIISHKTTHYDNQNNIIVFSAVAQHANIEDFNITFASYQGFESYRYDLPNARMTYFAVIPKEMRHFTFNYFNLTTRSYEKISLGIHVHDDSVSTQMDLAPTQYTHSIEKLLLALAIAVMGAMLYFFTKQKWFFFIVAVAPLLYVAWIYLPSQEICVKADAKIHLLPMQHATVFEKSSITEYFQKLGEVGEYTKILLPNETIGWIKDEDVCHD